MTERPSGLVLGIGLSSKATAHEVRSLVDAALAERGLRLDDIEVVATRQRFVLDGRLHLGPPVTGVADALLESWSAPCTRAVGIRARVAETAALLTASVRTQAHLLGAVHRSAHATVAIACARAGAGAP